MRDMAEVAGQVRLRALDLGELLDETFRVYRARFWLFFSLALTLAAPTVIFLLGSGAYRSGDLFTQLGRALQSTSHPAGGLGSPPPIAPADLGTILAWEGVLVLVALLLAPYSVGLVASAACDVALGRPASYGSTWGRVARRYWTLWGILILEGLVAIIGVLIITIPIVIWILVGWALAWAVVFVEEGGAGAAISRSWQLVRGSWWSTFGRLFLLGILTFVVSLAAQAIATLVSFVIPFDDPRLAFRAVLTAVAGAAAAPVTPIATVLIYLDLRVRKESLDLQVMAARSGGLPPPPGQPPPGYPAPGAPWGQPAGGATGHPPPGGYAPPAHPTPPQGYPPPSGYPPPGGPTPGSAPPQGYPPPSGYPPPGGYSPPPGVPGQPAPEPPPAGGG
jgi:hypothetical protein